MRRGLMIALISVAAVLVMLVLAAGVFYLFYDPTVSTGDPEISLDGTEAVVSVEVDLPAGISIKSSDLELVSGSSRNDIELDGNTAEVKLGITDFARIIANREVQVTGSVDAEVFFSFIVVTQDVDENIDLSGVLGLSSSFSASNFKVEPTLSGILVSMDYSTGIETDLDFTANDVEATLTTPFGPYTATVEKFVLNEDGSGEVAILFPFELASSFTPDEDSVTVEFAGISFTFDYPLGL